MTFSAVLTGWTSVALLSNTNYKPEIREVIVQMYLNQKDFLLNVKDLSILLVKDANKRFQRNHDENTLNKKVLNKIKEIKLSSSLNQSSPKSNNQDIPSLYFDLKNNG